MNNYPFLCGRSSDPRCNPFEDHVLIKLDQFFAVADPSSAADTEALLQLLWLKEIVLVYLGRFPDGCIYRMVQCCIRFGVLSKLYEGFGRDARLAGFIERNFRFSLEDPLDFAAAKVQAQYGHVPVRAKPLSITAHLDFILQTDHVIVDRGTLVRSYSVDFGRLSFSPQERDFLEQYRVAERARFRYTLSGVRKIDRTIIAGAVCAYPSSQNLIFGQLLYELHSTAFALQMHSQTSIGKCLPVYVVLQICEGGFDVAFSFVVEHVRVKTIQRSTDRAKLVYAASLSTRKHARAANGTFTKKLKT